jgi:ferredoxin
VALEIEIDGDLCIGSGNCVYEAEGVFTLDDEGISVVVDPAASPEDKVLAAARKCPSRAITVRRDGVIVA